MQLSRLASDYLRHITSVKGCSPRTEECYRLAYDQFAHHLRTRGLPDAVKHFTPDTVESFVAFLLGEGMKRSSVGIKLSALASLGAWAKTRKDERGRYVLDENPVERIERPKKDHPIEKYLTASEVRSILGAECAPNEKLALLILFETQCRSSELVRAKVADLRLDDERAAIPVTLKGGRSDLKRLSAETTAILLGTLKEREAGPKEPLLVNREGRAYNRSSISELVVRVAKRAGVTRVRVGAHLFARHSAASIAGQLGSTVPEIAAMLGHADFSTARRYTHGVSADAARDRVMAAVRGER
jgi:site-specific recombinase XerD